MKDGNERYGCVVPALAHTHTINVTLKTRMFIIIHVPIYRRFFKDVLTSSVAFLRPNQWAQVAIDGSGISERVRVLNQFHWNIIRALFA